MPDKGSRGNKRSQISYKEVDSDVDMDSEEEKVIEQGNKTRKRTRRDDSEEDEYSVGDTYGTTKKNSKAKSTSKKNKKNKKPKYTSRLLLELPFDLFVEVCEHLETSDIFNLAKVNKSLHKIVVSRSARSIWSSARKRDGYKLPSGLDEIRFAVFFSGRCCDGCGARSYLDRSTFLRTTLCKECRAERTVTSDKLGDSYPDLHPRAIDCVRFQQGRYTGVKRDARRRTRYMVSDLLEVDVELAELEEEDELVGIVRESEKERYNVRSRRGRSSVRQTPASGNEEEDSESLVQEYVERRAEWVKEEQRVSLELENRESTLRHEKSQEYWSKRQNKRNERQERYNQFSVELEELDWNEDDLDIYQSQYVYRGSKEVPVVTPSANPSAWSKYLAEIRKGQIRHDPGRVLRKSLAPFYESLKITESTRRAQIFPVREEFERLPSIKNYWQGEKSSVMTKSLWLSLLPSVLADLDVYSGALRVEAIRAILAAQQRISMSKLSTRSSDYPESRYPDSFFDLATSLFSPGWSAAGRRPERYPSVGFDGNYTWTGKGTFSRLAASRTTSTIQAIIQAAGLDPGAATAADLDALGRRFTWDNDSRVNEKDKLRTWHELVRSVTRFGHNKTRYKDGSATTEVSYWPQVDTDGNAYLDESGDGPGEVIESDDDGGEESERQRSDSEEEGSEEEGAEEEGSEEEEDE